MNFCSGKQNEIKRNFEQGVQTDLTVIQKLINNYGANNELEIITIVLNIQGPVHSTMKRSPPPPLTAQQQCRLFHFKLICIKMCIRIEKYFYIENTCQKCAVPSENTRSQHNHIFKFSEELYGYILNANRWR